MQSKEGFISTTFDENNDVSIVENVNHDIKYNISNKNDVTYMKHKSMKNYCDNEKENKEAFNEFEESSDEFSFLTNEIDDIIDNESETNNNKDDTSSNEIQNDSDDFSALINGDDDISDEESVTSNNEDDQSVSKNDSQDKILVDDNIMDNYMTYDDLDDENEDIINDDEEIEDFLPTTNSAKKAYIIENVNPKGVYVAGRVLLNTCGKLLTRSNHRINTYTKQQNFMEKMVATCYGQSQPLIYMKAQLFPSIFYFSIPNGDGSVAGAIPSCLFIEEESAHGLASLDHHIRSRLTSPSIAQALTQDTYHSHLISLLILQQTMKIIVSF